MPKPIIFETKANAEKRRKSLRQSSGYVSTKFDASIMNLEFGINKPGWVITSTSPGSPKKYIGSTKAGTITKIVKGKVL